jgi:hypothetical protein
MGGNMSHRSGKILLGEAKDKISTAKECFFAIDQAGDVFITRSRNTRSGDVVLQKTQKGIQIGINGRKGKKLVMTTLTIYQVIALNELFGRIREERQPITLTTVSKMFGLGARKISIQEFRHMSE